MKPLYIVLLTSLFLQLTACQNQKQEKKTNKLPKKEKKLVIVHRQVPLSDLSPVEDAVKKNNYFTKLYESFKPQTYSVDELIDLSTKNLQLIKSVQSRHFKSKADTAAVKSRLILTEINIKKLHFLLQKPERNKDTIEKTLNAIIINLNDVIDKIQVYSQSTDEFESILAHDSLAKIRKDSIFKRQQIDSLK